MKIIKFYNFKLKLACLRAPDGEMISLLEKFNFSDESENENNNDNNDLNKKEIEKILKNINF